MVLLFMLLVVQMITWMAMMSSRDRPRKGARGALRTYRGGPDKGHWGDPAYRGGPEEGHRPTGPHIAADVTWE